MAGEYAELVRLAQADDDPQHRQLAMSQITIIAPMVGMNTSGADAMAAPVIARLYPPAPPKPAADDSARDSIAAIEAEAQARFAAIVAEHTARALAAVRAAIGPQAGD